MASLLGVIAAAALLAACASNRAIPLDQIAPATLIPVSQAGVRDLRGAYRAVLCARLPDCKHELLRLADEPPTEPLPPVPDLPARYRIAFVPGIFAECAGDAARPFADVQRDLGNAGFSTDYVPVAGRGTAAANAEQIAQYVRGIDSADGRPLIVFGYSKGIVDVMEFVARYPAESARVAAVVSVAGAANGSPFADGLGSFYRTWGSAFPLSNCVSGSGDEIEDLRRDVRVRWWQTHPTLAVPIFALVTAPTPDRVSPILATSYDDLADVDPHNDGQVLWQDQIPPRSALLGFANADHWSIAIPLSQKHPLLSFLFRDEAVPRTALIESAIEVVASVLATPPPPDP